LLVVLCEYFQRFISYTKAGTKQIEPIVITVIIIIIHAAVITPETILKNAVIFRL